MIWPMRVSYFRPMCLIFDAGHRRTSSSDVDEDRRESIAENRIHRFIVLPTQRRLASVV
ncbi:hypothetical protein RCH21_001842 [Arthrobacter sp. PL16]|jgi:hypothetical protein|nr:hypothetical protein [Arthrobacter sp. PL16]